MQIEEEGKKLLLFPAFQTLPHFFKSTSMNHFGPSLSHLDASLYLFKTIN